MHGKIGFRFQNVFNLPKYGMEGNDNSHASEDVLASKQTAYWTMVKLVGKFLTVFKFSFHIPTDEVTWVKIVVIFSMMT